MNQPTPRQALSHKVNLPPDSDNPLLTCTIELPQMQNDKKFNRFYDKICNNCIAFCQNELIKSCSALNADTQTPTYAYRIRYKSEEQDANLSITLIISLSDKRSRKLLYSHKETHLWKKQGKYYALCK